MTFGELKNAGFGNWSISEWRDSDRASTTALEELATGYGFAIDDWDIAPFCIDDNRPSDGIRYQRLALPEEILKRGREHIKKLSPKPWNARARKQLLDNETEALAQWVAKENGIRTKEQQEQKLRDAEVTLSEKTLGVTSALRHLTRRRRAAEKTKDTPTDIKALTAVLAEGFYELLEIEEDCIRFITRPVFLSETNRKAKLELRVNLGEFVLGIGLTGLDVWIDQHRNNLKANGYIHPHVSSGNLCLGSALSQYEKLARTGDIAGILKLYQLCLHHYNPGSCYAGLEYFVAAAEKRDAKLRGEKEPAPTTAPHPWRMVTVPTYNTLFDTVRDAQQVVREGTLSPAETESLVDAVNARTNEEIERRRIVPIPFTPVPGRYTLTSIDDPLLDDLADDDIDEGQQA